MKFRFLVLAVLTAITGWSLEGQETSYGTGFNTIIINNPGFSGAEGDGVLRMSYLNFYPGHNYSFQTFFVSYDSYFESIHGGAGIYISNDHLGSIVNDLRGGLSYSYFLQAGDDFYINAGLSASFFNRGFDFSRAVLPDQINALGIVALPSAENLVSNRKTVLDIATGFVLITGNWLAGISVSHLAQPDISASESSADRLKRKFLFSFAGDIGFGKRDMYRFRPVGAVELQGRYISVCEGAVVETQVLSFNSALYETSNKTIDMQAGFSVRKGKVGVFYNYRFNIKSGSPMLPFSIVHQAGIRLVLNNVEKRIKVKTINMPQL